MSPSKSFALAAVLLLASSGCELTEVSLVDTEDVVIAEVYALMGAAPTAPAENRLWAYLHRSLGTDGAGEVLGASVVVTVVGDGRTIQLQETEVEECVREPWFGGTGTCYDAGPASAILRPGMELALEIRTSDGRVLNGLSRTPGAFALDGIDSFECALEPDTPFEIQWSRSEGAWAYINETRINDLRRALQPEGITVATGPLYLLGLSVSASDTTVVFPSEFGVFDRFDLDQDLAVRLQRGLPAGTYAAVGITAVDRNYVNWVRGGNFNPSGAVRIPSLRGDGTGVFASGVLRRFQAIVEHDGFPGPRPECPVG